MQPENYYGEGIELTPTILKALKKNDWEICQTTNEPSVLISKWVDSITETRVTVKQYLHLPPEVRYDAEHPYASFMEFKTALDKYMTFGPGRRAAAPYAPSIMKVWLLDENVCRILNEVNYGYACLNTEAFERLMQFSTNGHRLDKLVPDPDTAVYVYSADWSQAYRRTLIEGTYIHVMYANEVQDLAMDIQSLLDAPYKPFPPQAFKKGQQ